jgi:glycosyltransferase involved in cell wall biosynthesis
MAPEFTVVIPTYNHAEFLSTALRSVLDQTFTNFEVVIINNHSTDNTLEVINSFEDQRVRVINFSNNRVIGASRNLGIRESTGSYVAFLDSDDTWHQDKLQKVAEAIASDPDIGLICHNQFLVRDGVVSSESSYGPPDGYDGEMFDYILFEGNGPSTSATVVARKFLEQVGNFSEDQKLVTVEDYDLWLNLSKICAFKYLTEVLGSVNYHSSNTSGNVPLHLQNGLTVIEKHCGSMAAPKGNFSKIAIRRLYARSYYAAGRKYQRTGAFRPTVHYYARTIQTYPFFVKAYAGLVLLMADAVLGKTRRRKLTGAIWSSSNRWG